MINKDYGYIDNGNIIYAPTSFRVKIHHKETIENPETGESEYYEWDEEYTEQHPELNPESYANAYPNPFYPNEDNPPIVPEDKTLKILGWTFDSDRKVNVRNYELVDKSHTVDDYDKAMEDYITSVRVGRGYTTREPSAYLGSSVEKFHQDALDWQKFIDEVMTYALDILNTVSAGGEAPSISEFISNMPKCSWTISE